MQKISTQDFQKEIQEIDPRLMIVPNQNRPGASNIFLNGVDICPWVNSFEIQDEHSPDYTYQLNDMPVPFKTSVEIKEIINMTLNQLKDPTVAEEFFDTSYAIPDATQYK